MSDIASLGLRIDSSQTVAATTALDKFAAAAKPAANAAAGLEKAAASASKSTTAIAASGGAAAGSLTNLSFQINDIASGLAMGQSPFTILAQQGGQVFQVWQQNNNVFKQAASAVTSFLTPMRLLAGGTALAGAAAYVAYGQWKSFALALDDTAKQAGVTSGEMAKLQASASFKGIDSEEFTKGITSFSQQIYLAKQNAGGLLDVFRANGQQVGTFTGSLEKAADLIQRASSDQQRLVLLQQMGLPANMQWVRLLEQGSAGLARLKGQTTEFGSAANDQMVMKAREFDEAWNKAWTNFGLGWKTAFVGASGMLDTLIQKGREGLLKAGVDVGGNLLKMGVGTTSLGGVGDEFYKAVGAKGRTDPNATKDPNAVKNALALEQQRIGILGQTASVLEQVRSVELQIQSARLNGVKITADEAANLKKLAEANAIGLTQIRAQTDAMNVDAATVGMSTGAAVALTAEMNRLNQARRDGQTLTADNIAAIRAEATALGEAAQRAEQMRWGYESLVRGPMQAFQQQLAQGATFFDALRASGISALNAISSKLMDMAAQNLWKSAFGGGGGLLSSIFGGGGGGAMSFGGDLGAGTGGMAFPTFHTGFGPGDAIKNTRYVHPAHFNDAPRFHSGIGPGERAAIIRTDESVLTPGQMKALGNGAGGDTVVNITNNNTFNGADAASEARLKAYVDQSSQRAVNQAVQAVSQVKSTTPGYAGGVR